MKARSLSIFAAAFGFALAFLAGTASALPIDKVVTVQVFQLCDDSGNNCASLGPLGNEYFAAETDAIWAQAGIDVNFNFVQQINSTAWLHINDSVAGDGFVDLYAMYGVSPLTTVSMFLVQTVNDPAPGVTYGEAFVGAGGLVIGMQDVMAASRRDTIAHELGHTFGLCPTAVSSCDPGGNYHATAANNLMAPGSIRLIPTSLSDIAPNGLGYDYLPEDQIALVRQSSLVQDAVPEPASVAVIAMGLLAVGTLRRARAH